MPNQAQNGYAFEYSIIKSIPEEIENWVRIHREGSINYRIIEDEAYANVREKFELTEPTIQNRMLLGAKAGIRKILDMEPRLTHATSKDPIIISSQPSSAGIVGDVRDIVMIRQIPNTKTRHHSDADAVNWEIGISAKWNNDVIKNSRLAEKLDFCYSWFRFPCTSTYWENIRKPMEILKANLGTPWGLLKDKKETIYYPMTQAFIDEMNLQSQRKTELPRLLIEYLLGKFDFYKLMTHNAQKITNIQAFNLRGFLNQECDGNSPLIRIPQQTNQYPSRIVSVNRYRNRPAWVEIILDNGWQFTLRLHNAETLIQTSLKFDIRFAGSPVNTWSENW